MTHDCVRAVLKADSPLVSVVIPSYNCAKYLGGALRSVSRQNYVPVEVVVVDDASTDGTLEAVRGSGVACIYLRQTERRGPAYSRNRGIERATGKYIAFLDADDEWLNGKLFEQVALLERDASIVAVSGEMIPWSCKTHTAVSVGEVSKVSFLDMVVKNRFRTPTVVARRQAIIDAGMFDETLVISEDFDLWLRLAEFGQLACMEAALARFRARPNGLSAGDRKATYQRDVAYVRMLQKRFPHRASLRGWINRGLAARALERAIEQCDIERQYWAALRETLRSVFYWPWGDPCSSGQAFLRLRRVRRIAVDFCLYRDSNYR